MGTGGGGWREKVCVGGGGVVEVAGEMGGYLGFEDAVGGGGSSVGFGGGRAGGEVRSGVAVEGVGRWVNGLVEAGVVVVAEAGTAAFFVYHIYAGILFVVTLAARTWPLCWIVVSLRTYSC